LLVIWLQPLPVSAASSDARDAALAFVEQRHIGNNLASMGWIVAIRTTTFGVLSKKLGEPATSLLATRSWMNFARNIKRAGTPILPRPTRTS
jgi:hypothetical protein